MLSSINLMLIQVYLIMHLKQLLYRFCIILFIAALPFLFFACAKASSDPDKNVSTTPAGNTSTTSFQWTPGVGNSITADSSNYYSSFTTIFAFKNGNNNSLEINLSSLAVGSYTLSSATGNALTYIANSSTYTAKSGQVNITANSSTNISGNFTCALSGGTLTTLSGQFVDIPKR